MDGNVIYCYEYYMEIDPSQENDEYYAIQLVYQGTNELVYLQQLGEVYHVSPSKENILNGKIRIQTVNDVKAEYFIYEIQFHKIV